MLEVIRVVAAAARRRASADLQRSLQFLFLFWQPPGDVASLQNPAVIPGPPVRTKRREIRSRQFVFSHCCSLKGLSNISNEKNIIFALVAFTAYPLGCYIAYYCIICLPNHNNSRPLSSAYIYGCPSHFDSFHTNICKVSK